MLLEQTKIGKKYKNIIRYKQIISVLIKHGFYDFVEHSKLLKNLHPKEQQGIPKPEVQNATAPKGNHWVRVRLVLEELGPSFIKLGQFVSNRPDLIPDDLCEELQKLLDHVPPFDNNEALKLLEQELNISVEEEFAEFDVAPFSSASIAQVHKAVLKDGHPVAIKIQRPGIKKIINSDLEVMYHIAELIKKHVAAAEVIDPVSIVEEFKEGILSEIDFENEANNINKFKMLFKGDDKLIIPNVFRNYVTEHILIMDFIDGINLSDLSPADPPKHLNMKKLVSNFTDLVLKQIFEVGFFHADPHAGNIIICEGNKICLVDFGLMGILPPKHKTLLCEMIFGLVNNNAEQIMRAVVKISLNKEIEDKNTLENEIYKIVESYIHLPLEEINISHFLRDLISTIVKNKIILPSTMYILLKSLISLEGSARKYEPSFNMLAHIEPYVRKMIFENSSPKKFLKDLYTSGFDYFKLLKELPIEIRDIFDLIKSKTLKIQFEIKGLEPMLEKHDQIVNRLSFSIVTASMLIGSTLILKSHIPPMIGKLSLIGAITFAFSLFMGVLLLISILRHGKM
jgi:ubiquinone biosynthesis protein